MAESPVSIEQGKQLYHRLFNLVPACILRLDRKIRVIEANRVALQKLGPKDCLSEQPLLGFVDDDYRQACRNHFENDCYYSNWNECEVVLRPPSGEYIQARLHSTALTEEMTKQRGFLTVVMDITQEKQSKADINHKNSELNQVNVALKVLLDSRQKELGSFKESIRGNIVRSVQPLIRGLAKSVLNREQRIMLNLLRENLENLTDGFTYMLTSALYGLTPRQIEIATLIRDGLSSDEIADILNVSTSCVSFHRNKIRSKLGLVGKKGLLVEHLQKMMHHPE